ncbi:MAG TPA: NAD-dependent epimerase/dehydratase family protein [Dictyobacter sp.]|nr:NAD-dependent epimerase/dehydratase family protein [Dictyobacter sp.]
MKIAIIGGAGFIGTQLARAYLDARHDVFVIDNLSNGNPQHLDSRVRLYQIDIRDTKLHTILQHERPDIVSHHATQNVAQNPGEHTLADADIHVRGLLHLLDGCVQANVKKFIFASGGNGFYERSTQEQLPIDENAPLHPHSAHDISRLAGEWYVRYYTKQFGLQHTILRYADVYGEHRYQRLRHPISYFITMLTQKQRPVIRGTGETLQDHIFIDDVVAANIQALLAGNNATIHISSAHGYSLNQLYQLVAEALDSYETPIHLSSTLAEQSSIVLDNTRACQLLKWQPAISIEKGIEQAIAQLKTPGPQMASRDIELPVPKLIIPVKPTLTHA